MDKAHFKRRITGAMICFVGVFVILTIAISSYAQNTKKKNGLNFQVPEDWPIEKRGGIVVPIPTEEYFSIKFKATEEEFQIIKADLISKFEELQLDIKNMEVNFTKEVQKIQAQADSQAGIEEDSTDLISRLSLLESNLERLDRKITNKVLTMNTKSQETDMLIKSFEKKIEDLKLYIEDLDREIDKFYDKQGSAY